MKRSRENHGRDHTPALDDRRRVGQYLDSIREVERVVVLGNGIAGVTAADHVRRRHPLAQIDLVAEEGEGEIVVKVMDRGPGAEQQILHRDEDVWIHLPRPHAEVQLASVIALVDFTADIGATVVAPGSHRWERDRYPTPDEMGCAEMPAGSAVVYLGSTLHAGGANSTADRWRRGMHMSFVVGWLRTEENNYLSTPPEVVRTPPRRSQELLGYAAHDALNAGGGYLGLVDLLDPIDLLADGKL